MPITTGCPSGKGSTDGWNCGDDCAANSCQEGSPNGAPGLQSCTACGSNAVCAAGQPNDKCTCNAGYTGNGTACADVDECALKTAGCDANAYCNNTAGGYACTCNAGYSGNGTACADVDECAAAPSPCDANALYCNNTVGDYTCTCEHLYFGLGKACSLAQVTLCDQNWVAFIQTQPFYIPLFPQGEICGVPGDQNTSYWFDFDTGSKVPADSTVADLSKGYNTAGSEINTRWTVWNNATHVATSSVPSAFDSVVCSAADGRAYVTSPFSYAVPRNNVVCLRTGVGAYFKYVAVGGDYGAITIRYERGGVVWP